MTTILTHTEQVIQLLRKQIGNETEVNDIRVTAGEVAKRWVPPLSGGAEETNGLIYGLIQSGKTGVLTVTGAIGADEGYRTLLILTSDIDPLYAQTLGRAKEAFPGIDIIGKTDFKDADAFIRRLKAGTCAIVTTKNAGLLETLIENFKKGNLKGLSCLIIDDEADQASLNTKAKKADGSRSAINDRIATLRGFFQKNTYLQVTATPQALFLQDPKHAFRPKFTVLSHPGYEYVGGDDFFGDKSQLVVEFPIDDISVLAAGPQPDPGRQIPASLLRALDTFIIGATYKRTKDPEQNCAFLCHVSTKTTDHDHIVDLLRKYKTDLAKAAKERDPALVARLTAVHRDLGETHQGVKSIGVPDLIEAIAFFSPGISVKLVNGMTDEDVAVQSPYNLFVGGNKLGRGVTIKNLLVSYYGRNPKKPQADTVLQHARMYGYRRKDLGLLRLFLPKELHLVFKAINNMEKGLRELIDQSPGEEFRGVYLEDGLHATRASVIAPGALGVYSGGSTYNPAQVLRGQDVVESTEKLDALLRSIEDRTYKKLELNEIRQLIELTHPDPNASEHVWDPIAISGSIGKFASIKGDRYGYVYVDRNRGLVEARRETQGILEGGEAKTVPDSLLTLFILRTKSGKGLNAAWWPQVRFPSGRYAFAFSV